MGGDPPTLVVTKPYWHLRPQSKGDAGRLEMRIHLFQHSRTTLKIGRPHHWTHLSGTLATASYQDGIIQDAPQLTCEDLFNNTEY